MQFDSPKEDIRQHNFSGFFTPKSKSRTRPKNIGDSMKVIPKFKNSSSQVPIPNLRKEASEMKPEGRSFFPRLNTRSASENKLNFKASQYKARESPAKIKIQERCDLEKEKMKRAKLRIIKLAERGRQAFRRIINLEKPKSFSKSFKMDKRKTIREIDVVQPTVSVFEGGTNTRQTTMQRQSRLFTPQSTQMKMTRLKSGISSSSQNRIRTIHTISLTKTAQKNIERKNKKLETIKELLSKNSKIDELSPIFYKIPNSVILKSSSLSAQNDKLAEMNQGIIAGCNLLQRQPQSTPSTQASTLGVKNTSAFQKPPLNTPQRSSKSRTTSFQTSNSRTAQFNKAIRIYIEKELVKRLKQNTWNWVVANKIGYVNFISNNYEKMKNWYIKHYLDQRKTEGELIESIVFTKKKFYKMMHGFGLGKDTETLEKIFWVLDKDDSGEVDYIEFIMGIQMMKQNSFKEKIISFFDMCDIDGDGYVDKNMFKKIKKEFNFSNSHKKLGSMMDKITREELIKMIESKEFIKELKPFNLAEYFKQYESMLYIQSNDVSNLARICRAIEEKTKIEEENEPYYTNE